MGGSLNHRPGRSGIACIGFLMLLLVASPDSVAQVPFKLTASAKKKMEELKPKLSTSELECVEDLIAGKVEERNFPQLSSATGPKAISPGQVGYIDTIFQVSEILDGNTSIVHLSAGDRTPELGLPFILKGFATKSYIAGSKWYGTEKRLVFVRKSDDLKDPRLPKATMVIEVVTNPAFVEALSLLVPKPVKKRR